MNSDTSPTLLLLLAAMLSRNAGASPMLIEDPGLGRASNNAPTTLALALPTRASRRDRSYTSKDLRITTSIRSAFRQLAIGSDTDAIRIVTRNGAVSLTGVIKDGSQRSRIEGIVLAVPGAWRLTDSLQVQD